MNSLIKTVFLFLSLFCFFSANKAFAGNPGYAIKIRVKGIKDTTCYLAYHFGDKQYLKDTAKVDSKGSFVFEGKEPLPGGIYMAVLPDKRYFEFIVSEQFFSLETDTADYVKHMKVTGSVENKAFYDYLQYLYPKGVTADSVKKAFANAKTKSDTTILREKLAQVDKDIIEYRRNVIKTHPTAFVSKIFKSMEVIEPTQEQKDAAKARKDTMFEFNYYRAHFFDNMDFTDDKIVRTPIYHQKIKEFITNLTVPTVDSINKAADWLVEKSRANKELFKYTVWYITTSNETSNLMGADGVFVHMVEKYYMTNQAFWVDTSSLRKITERAMLLKPLLIGKVIPNMTLWDSLRTPYTLHNVKAKYTILYFWDPNCGHCQKETPKLYDVYKKYYSKGVETYAVNIDRNVKDWTKYIRQHNLNWINVCDWFYSEGHTISFRQQYDIYSTPVIYILDEKKKIIAKRIGVEQVDEILDSYINKKPMKKNIQKAPEH